MNHSIMDFSFNTNMVHVDHPVLLCLTVPPPQDIRKAILAIREFFIINKTRPLTQLKSKEKGSQ